mmetsp:Transcript_4843/g.8076  ORF Transcript_4843/g.8076 Transcript_4843/m.8076 type:complete len:109 (+) Transcript_4843:1-327(+)
MKDHQIRPNVRTFSTVLDGCATAGVDAKELERWIKIMAENGIQPNQITYNTIIKAHARKGSVGQCEKVFREMTANNFLPDMTTFNTMLEGHRTSAAVAEHRQKNITAV